MKPVGKQFVGGNPYLSPQWTGIHATWPSGSMSAFEECFTDERQSLENHLFSRSQAYMCMYKLGTPQLPQMAIDHPQKSNNFFLTAGGATFEFGTIGKEQIAFFRYFTNDLQQIMGFNLASDLIEFLDLGIRAPRIDKTEGGDFRLDYPLPEGITKIPRETFSQTVRDVYGEVGFKFVRDRDKICNDEKRQIVYNSRGVIRVEDGFVFGEGFKLPDVIRASYVIATLVDSTYLIPAAIV